MSFMSAIVITHAMRTPFGVLGGQFKEKNALDLLFDLVNPLDDQLKKNVDMLNIGCTLTTGLGPSPAQSCASRAHLLASLNANLIHKGALSSLQAHFFSSLCLWSEINRAAISAGVESVSRAPYLLPRDKPLFGDLKLQDPLVSDVLWHYDSQKLLGLLAEDMAETHKITRQEQEAYILERAHKALEAYENGLIGRELGQGTKGMDQALERFKIDDIARLPVLFGKTITPATTAPLSDGAALSVMMPQAFADELGFKPLAILLGFAHVVRPSKEFMLAPLYALQKLSIALDLPLKDVDLFEIHELFALNPLLCIKLLELPQEKVNAYGGECLFGYVPGASGARLIVRLVHSLIHTGKKRGFGVIGSASGEALAVAIECFS